MNNLENLLSIIREAFLSGKSLTQLEKDLNLNRRFLSKKAKEIGLAFPRNRQGRKKTINKERFIGKRFGILTVESYCGRDKKGSLWGCKCDCGNFKIIPNESLRIKGGKSGAKSCGCLQHRKSNKSWNWTGFEEISGSKWKSIISSAKKRNISFDIKIEDAYALFLKQNKKCALSGDRLSFIPNCFDKIASLDRIDSTKGYEIGNVQWVSKEINYMKLSLSQGEFFQICKKIVNFNNL